MPTYKTVKKSFIIIIYNFLDSYCSIAQKTLKEGPYQYLTHTFNLAINNLFDIVYFASVISQPYNYVSPLSNISIKAT